MSDGTRSRGRVVLDVVFLILAAFAALFLASAVFARGDARTHFPVTFSWATAGIAIGVVTLLLTRSRRYTRTQIGTAPDASTFVQALFGLTVGAVLAALAVAITVATASGQLSVNTNLSVLALVASFANLVGAAIAEEVLFRAGLVGPLATAFPRWVAIAVPASIFGLVHLHNPGSSWLSTLMTTLAGIALGLLYFDPAGSPTTPSLGLCVGVHAGWNFVLGSVFGGAVSGYDLGASVWKLESHDALWSGGAYGVEAGLSSVIVWTVLTVILTYRSRAFFDR